MRVCTAHGSLLPDAASQGKLLPRGPERKTALASAWLRGIALYRPDTHEIAEMETLPLSKLRKALLSSSPSTSAPAAAVVPTVQHGPDKLPSASGAGRLQYSDLERELLPCALVCVHPESLCPRRPLEFREREPRGLSLVREGRTDLLLL